MSEISQIRNQFQAGLWPQFLQMVSIDGLHGWQGQSVEFNFPVVAVVGENGSGKTTLLKTAACVYDHPTDQKKRFRPSSFFVETVWDVISGVELNARVKRGNLVENVRMTKPTSRWRIPDNAPKRPVYFLDISRTVPLDASAGYAKIARSAVEEIESAELSDEFRKGVGYVLGRQYAKARFVTSDVDRKRNVGLLEREFGELSQFHQGAGEDATLDLFGTLEGLPDYSLLIVDEVEASLHPRAQRRLVQFLLWLARTRKIQVILSTHSKFVLDELPQEARVLLLPGPQGLNVVYGVSAAFAMGHLDDSLHPELVVFVEDRDASILLREIIASDAANAELLRKIDIKPVGPYNVVSMLADLGVGNKLPYKSCAVVDGDQPAGNALKLPGAVAPERVIYLELRDAVWNGLHERFGIGAGTLHTILEDAILLPDHHDWNTYVGDRVLKSSTSVWEIMANQWCKVCLQAVVRDALVQRLNTILQV